METLNLDINYLPIATISIKQAISKLYKNKAQLLWGTIQYPLVIRQLNFDRTQIPTDSHNNRVSNWRLLQRDNYQCQYCSKQLSEQTITRDHIIPIKCGGRISYLNTVSCCWDCNQQKAGRLLNESGMKLLQQVKQPYPFTLNKFGKQIYKDFIELSYRLLGKEIATCSFNYSL